MLVFIYPIENRWDINEATRVTVNYSLLTAPYSTVEIINLQNTNIECLIMHFKQYFEYYYFI